MSYWDGVSGGSLRARLHVYKDIWGAAVGEELDCTRELCNPRDAYAVVVVRNRNVGHLPRKLFRLCALCSGEGSSRIRKSIGRL